MTDFLRAGWVVEITHLESVLDEVPRSVQGSRYYLLRDLLSALKACQKTEAEFIHPETYFALVLADMKHELSFLVPEYREHRHD